MSSCRLVRAASGLPLPLPPALPGRWGVLAIEGEATLCLDGVVSTVEGEPGLLLLLLLEELWMLAALPVNALDEEEGLRSPERREARVLVTALLSLVGVSGGCCCCFSLREGEAIAATLE